MLDPWDLTKEEADEKAELYEEKGVIWATSARGYDVALKAAQDKRTRVLAEKAGIA